MKKAFMKAFLIGSAALLPGWAHANLETNIANAIAAKPTAGQAAFEQLAPKLMHAFMHREVSVMADLGGGIGGFSLALDTVSTRMDPQAVKTLTGNSSTRLDTSTLVAPRLSAAAGLPVLPLNLSVSYADLGRDVYTLTSAQLGYAVWQGGAATPAMNLYYAYSTSRSLQVIDSTVHSVGVKLSKGLGIGVKLVPYIGVAYVSGESRLQASNGTNTYRFKYTKQGMQVMVGASFQLGMFEVAYQGDSLFGDVSHTLRVGVRF